jgi:ABC-type phosphate transport system substrate-binding protein/class 3 adenylate cyclase
MFICNMLYTICSNTLFSAVVLNYNIPNMPSDLVLSRETIVGIFNATIMKWNDPAIAAVNPGLNLPNEYIRRVVRADKSGTTEIFTSALSSFSPEWKAQFGVSQKPVWPNSTNNPYYIEGDTASGMARGVFVNYYSIGYNTLSSTLEAQLQLPNAPVINKSGKKVKPSTASVQSAMEDYLETFNGKFTAEIVDPYGEDSWPIAGYTYFVYRSKNMTECNEALLLYKYLRWIYSGIRIVDSTIVEKNFAPLPEIVKQRVKHVIGQFECSGQLMSVLAKPKHIVAYVLSFVLTFVVFVIVLIVVAGFLTLLYRQHKMSQLIDQADPGPDGFIGLVFTDVMCSTALWEADHDSMAASIELHNSIIRQAITDFNGYEVKTEGDSFMIAFGDPVDAIVFASEAQQRLVDADWPEALLKHQLCAEMADDNGEVIFRGIRVRIGLHIGEPVCKLDPTTKRTDYFGPVVNLAARIENEADGGTTYMSPDVRIFLVANSQKDMRVQNILDNSIIRSTGFYRLQGLSLPQELFLMLPTNLMHRDGNTIPNQKGTSRIQATTFEKESDRLGTPPKQYVSNSNGKRRPSTVGYVAHNN